MADNAFRQVLAVAATAAVVAAGVAGCSSHNTAPTATPAKAAVPQGVWQKQDLIALTGAPAAALGGIASYVSQPDGAQHVLYVKAQGHIEDLWHDGTGWHHKDLSTAAGGVPPSRLDVSGYSFQGAQHAIYLSTDHHVQDLWWDQSGAHVEDLTALTHSPLSTDAITGYGFEAQGTQHVIYRSWPDSYVHELWWDRSGWHHTDMAAVLGAPAADLGGHPAAYVFGGGQHVFYGGQDRHMHELWSDADGWHLNDVTAAAGAESSIGGFFTAYPFAAQGTQHVIYKSMPIKDTHLRELWWDHSGWHTDDLTATAGAPGSPWSVSGYAFEAQGTQHVIADADHIVELWSDRAGWHMNDLTTALGAPLSGGNGPVGYAFDAQGTQHAVYVGRDDRHIYELWWGPKAP